MKEKSMLTLFGFVSGILNGVFGSGGGMVVVPFLEKKGLEAQKAHATAIFVILPVTVASIFGYMSFGKVPLSTLSVICIGGALGAFLGAKLLKKISNKWLSKIFGVFIIIASLRMVIG